MSTNTVSDRTREERDFVVEDHGCIFFLLPLTPWAREWINEHIPLTEASLHWAGATVIEDDHIRDVLIGIQEAGGGF